jgi:carbamoyltransferase
MYTAVHEDSEHRPTPNHAHAAGFSRGFNMSVILGIQSGHESSAALFCDGKLVSAVSEERLTRIKNDGGKMPDLAIDEVLKLANMKRSDVDHLALQYTFYPEEYFIREDKLKEIERKFSRFKRKLTNKERPYMHTGNFVERLVARGKEFSDHFLSEKFLKGEGFSKAKVSFYDHHAAHALPAAYYSGFDDTAVMTMDGNGDWNINHTSCRYRNGQLTRIHTTKAEGSSAGLFYSHITRLLGFKALRHEGKIVGLAAMGNPGVLYDAFKKALRLSDDGMTMTSDFVGQHQAEAQRYRYLEKTIIGHSREDVSAAAQKVLEDVVVDLVRNFMREQHIDALALNGGVFANVKLNQRIAELPEVKRLFVFPPMSDTGNSIGAILLHLQETQAKLFEQHAEALPTMYLGREYTRSEILNELHKNKLQFEELNQDELINKSAQAIHDGRIVGWFQGRMEFGPRALGNRSMLARPTQNAINDWLNQRLDRSEFMPFAPSALEEHAKELFENIDKSRHTAEFMTITYDVKPEWRARIAAVVHVDGTARPQFVTKQNNPLYHKLISAYHKLSGIPLVLNTSFNVHEEPIVCAPTEAVRAFVEKRVDCLAIGNFWLEHPAE